MWAVKREELVEAVNCTDLSRSLSNSGDADGIEMGLIGKTRESQKIRKTDSSEVQPAFSIVCGQRHSRWTREEIKELYCGEMQVTLERGERLFKKSPELRCCFLVLYLIADKTTSASAKSLSNVQKL